MTDKVMKENKSFEFTYSAKQQQEIESIRKKYLPKKEDKMETLRRLDREAERPGVITALAVGIMGTMLLGIGMCCTMVWGDALFVLGIFIGILGITILSTAYPIYNKITKKQREKIADQILSLSAEIAL